MAENEWVDDLAQDGGDWVDDSDGKSSPIVSGVRKFSQGATAGFSDEIAGAGEAVGRTLGLEGVGGPIKDIKKAEDGPTVDWQIIKDAYKRARDAERAALKKDSKDNPGVAAAAEFAGAILSPVNKVAQGASLAKQGMAVGGAIGLGNSEADLTEGEYGKAAVDTATGAAIGGVLGKGVEKAVPVIQKGASAVGKKARDLAERFAARAVGAERGTIKKLGAEKVKDIGRYALDEGLLTPLSSTDDVVSRNLANKAKGGQMMDDVYTTIDNARASKFNPLEVAGKVDEKLGGFYRSPINKGEANQLENTLESILMRGDRNIPLKQAQVLKQELGKVANWKNNINITDKEKMAREAYSIVSKSIDDAAEQGAKSIHHEGIEKSLKIGKKLYGDAKGAEELLTNKVAREQGNKIVGLTDAITGAGALGYGGVTGDWKTAGALVLAKKGLQKYGAQTAALTLNKVSKALLSAPKFANLQATNPKAFQAVAQSLLNKSGQGPNIKSAERNEEPSKGPSKWAKDGIAKLKQHFPSGSFDKLLATPEGKKLLIAASDLKPGSKAMQDVLAQIKSKYKGEL